MIFQKINSDDIFYDLGGVMFQMIDGHDVQDHQ